MSNIAANNSVRAELPGNAEVQPLWVVCDRTGGAVIVGPGSTSTAGCGNALLAKEALNELAWLTF